jgi:hypothetical protein
MTLIKCAIVYPSCFGLGAFQNVTGGDDLERNMQAYLGWEVIPNLDYGGV